MFRACAIVFTLAALLPISPALAEWREATSEHFVVVSEGSENTLTRINQSLETIHWLMTEVTGVSPAQNAPRIKVYLVNSVEQVSRAMGIRTDVDHPEFYLSNVGGSVLFGPSMNGTNHAFTSGLPNLYHGYAHQFIQQNMPATFPPWFAEGFAEMVSSASFVLDHRITYGGGSIYASRKPWVPISRMFAPRSVNDAAAGEASYGQYWLVVHYLSFADSRRGQLDQFVHAINRGVSFTDAYGVFPGGLEQLDSDVRAYRHRHHSYYRAVTLPEGVPALPVIRTLRPSEAAILLLEVRPNRNLSVEQKRELARRIGLIALQYPDEPAVTLLHVRALFDAGDWAGAETAADKILEGDPENADALAYKSWAQFSEIQATGRHLTPAEASHVRAPIIRAIASEPNGHVPLLAYYYSFALAEQQTPESALQGLIRASDLIPQNNALRVELAMHLIHQRRLPLARLRLLPLAYAPHRSEQQAYALRLVSWIDGGAEGDLPPMGADGEHDQGYH